MKKINFKDCFYGLMLFVIVGVMPMLVRGVTLAVPPELVELRQREAYTDYLTYLKSWFVLIPALLLAFYSIADIATGGYKTFDIKKTIREPAVTAVLVYLLMAVISSVFSKYPYTAVNGTYDRHESIFILLSYMVVFIISYYHIRKRNHLLPVITGLTFSSIIIGAIGAAKLFGFDIFNWDPVHDFVSANGQYDFAVSFDIAFATLYNPNTYGLYSSMLFPFLLLCGFTYDGKKWVNALLILAGLLMLVGIPASNSLGGLTGGAAGVAVLVITHAAHSVFNKKKPPLPAVIAGAGVLAVLVGAVIFIAPVRSRFVGLADKIKQSMNVAQPPDYIIEGNTFTITNGGGVKLTGITFGENPWLTVTDGAGQSVAPQSIEYSEDAAEADRNDADPYNATVYYDIPGYGPLEFIRERGNGDFYIRFPRLRAGYNALRLAVNEDGLTPVTQAGAAVNTMKPAEAFGFKGMEKWGTMRGYIWSRSFPLMLRYPLVGSGPDSFINEFPNHDLLAKLRFFDNAYELVDKAHNLYIQTWITTGGISALALIFLFGNYIARAFVSLVKSKGEGRFSYGLRLGLLAGISAFCVSSLATDSTIASTAVFYVLLGLGYAANGADFDLTKTTAEAKKPAQSKSPARRPAR
jgi:O-antigen ligase